MLRTDQAFDANQHVAFRISAARDRGLVIAVEDAGEFHGHRNKGGFVTCGVDARPAVKQIGTVAAFQNVVAGSAEQRVGAGIIEAKKTRQKKTLENQILITP